MTFIDMTVELAFSGMASWTVRAYEWFGMGFEVVVVISY